MYIEVVDNSNVTTDVDVINKKLQGQEYTIVVNSYIRKPNSFKYNKEFNFPSFYNEVQYISDKIKVQINIGSNNLLKFGGYFTNDKFQLESISKNKNKKVSKLEFEKICFNLNQLLLGRFSEPQLTSLKNVLTTEFLNFKNSNNFKIKNILR